MLFYMIKRLGLALLVALTVSFLAYVLVFLISIGLTWGALRELLHL